ncbi:hypothetical protein LTR37_003233 [Vermiconidia calcicola]|uniref:Uncharacterized protein n=1 Tax=Vermiconidia calcicola TaxID=1690605 RepID=A0ACC3NSA7_9PEZI|nr:hypothetical protein LTR37_003233 [Vermiconidia calcicola]
MAQQPFDDAHLTSKHKQFFWLQTAPQTTMPGRGLQKTIMQLAAFPEFSLYICNAYHRFCSSVEPKSISGSVTSQLHTGPIHKGAREGHYETATCACCDNTLTVFDDTYCKTCSVYFAVFAKACEVNTHRSVAQATSSSKELELCKLTASSAPDGGVESITPATTPRSKTGKLLRSCQACERQFPADQTKNDGVHCTQCCNKRRKAAETQQPSPPYTPCPAVKRKHSEMAVDVAPPLVGYDSRKRSQAGFIGDEDFLEEMESLLGGL